MNKKITSLLSIIPLKPKNISIGEIILKMKLGTKRELKELNRDIVYLLKGKQLLRNKEGLFCLNPNMTLKGKKEIAKDPLQIKAPKKRVDSPEIEDSPALDVEFVCKQFHLPLDFSKRIIEETQQELKSKDISAEIKKRKNYQKELTLTIDGEDAKDLDDAISLKKEGEIFFLTVHIADVSFFLPENSLLDKEAEKRGNSFYLIDQVIPMLPFILSNEYCSLNPREEKLTFSCEMSISSLGEVLSAHFKEGSIKTTHRLSYNQVENILNTQDSKDPILLKTLNLLKELTLLLKHKRIKEGSLDFYLPEIKVACDSQGTPTTYALSPQLFAHSIIEEAMLLTNTIAAKLLWENKTGVFRIHESPSEEKLQNFYHVAKSIGLKVKPFRNSREIQSFLEIPIEENMKLIINTLLVRSMSQAQYSNKNIGHFGLGFSLYTHFTSPIRRYSDLIVHRQMKGILKLLEVKNAFTPSYLSKISKHLSETERVAVEAERKIQKIKGIRFLSNLPKETSLTAQVSALHPKGLFVTLKETGIEGMIAAESIPHFDYREGEYCYKNYTTQEKLIVGSLLVIKVLSLNLKRNFIDFSLDSIIKKETPLI